MRPNHRIGGGIKATSAADSLRIQLAENIGAQAGPVTRLSFTVNAEVVGIDATADREEVLRAVKEAIVGEDVAADAERREVTLTGLWSERSGHQVASISLPASVLRRVKIG